MAKTSNDLDKKLLSFFSAELQPGDRACFTSRLGTRIVGTVTKINGSNIKILADDGTPWTVTVEFHKAMQGS